MHDDDLTDLFPWTVVFQTVAQTQSRRGDSRPDRVDTDSGWSHGNAKLRGPNDLQLIDDLPASMMAAKEPASPAGGI